MQAAGLQPHAICLMPICTPNDVLISEVGLRDGLQSVKATMATAHKCA